MFHCINLLSGFQTFVFSSFVGFKGSLYVISFLGPHAARPTYSITLLHPCICALPAFQTYVFFGILVATYLPDLVISLQCCVPGLLALHYFPISSHWCVPELEDLLILSHLCAPRFEGILIILHAWTHRPARPRIWLHNYKFPGFQTYVFHHVLCSLSLADLRISSHVVPLLHVCAPQASRPMYFIASLCSQVSRSTCCFCSCVVPIFQTYAKSVMRLQI